MTSGKPRFFAGPPVLLAVPVLISLVTAALIWIWGPYDADPGYGPLMSALNLVHLKPPGYLDHPGTPVHILGAIVLVLGWLLRLPFTGFAGPDTDILRHPDTFLVYLNLVIALLISAANYFLGRQLLKTTGSLAAALVGQVTVFMAFPFLMTLPLPAPDSLLIATSTLFMALLAPLVFTNPPWVPSLRYAGILGAVFGVTIATKITCLPLGLLLFLLPGMRLQAQAMGAAILAFFLSILPGITLLPGVVRYYFAILIHNGHAGTGTQGPPSLDMLAANASLMLVPGEGLLVAFVGCCLALFAWPRLRALFGPRFPLLFVLCAGILAFQFILVLKQPGDRYLEPAYATAALLYPAWFLMARRLMPSRATLMQAALVTVMVLVTAGATATAWLWFRDAHIANSDNEALVARAANSGCDVVPYYNAPTKEYRLIFGNGTAAGRHSRSLARLYPDFLSFHNGRLRFETFEKVLTPAEAMTLLHGKKCIYLLGSTMERMQPFGIRQEMMQLVDRTNHGPAFSTAVYRLKITPETTWSDLGLPPALESEQ